jgi:hypothetical protein
VHRWNDADHDDVQDAGEWLAYYKTCDPAATTGANRYSVCTALPDADGDGIGGTTVRDAFGNVIYHANGNPYIYLYNVGTVGGTAVKQRTVIVPHLVAQAADLNADLSFDSISICGESANGYVLPEGEPDKTTPNGQSMQIEARYLDFLFSSYGDAARVAVFEPTTANDGIRTKSTCISLDAGESSTYETFRRTRLAALRLTLQTVTCELKDKVRFGIMQFRYSGITGDDNGGYVKLPVNSLLDENGDPTTYTLHGISDTHENHMKRVISEVGPDSQTPLGEALYQAYTFFMSRDPADLPPGRDWEGNPVTGVSFPVYEYNMETHNSDPDDGGDLNLPGGEYVGSAVVTTRPKNGTAASYNADGVDISGDGGMVVFPAWNTDAAPDPLDCGGGVPCGCQKNFLIVITDGFSSGDLFDDQDARVNAHFGDPDDHPAFVPVETGTDRGFADFFSLVGDHYRNPDGTADEVEAPGGSGTNYMDDLAYFMTRWDFRPDLDGDQTIDTYTVGYSVEQSGISNAEKAADRGNGLYFESHDADQLSQDIVAAFSDIIRKSQSFTSATVPASRTTDGNNFYSSFFLPKEDSPFWEGHLKNFEFSVDGDILTPSGNCAIGTDTAATPPCANTGPLRTTAEAYWDAADEIPDPEDRRLFHGAGATDFGELPPAWSLTGVEAVDLLLPEAALDPSLLVTLMDDPYLLPDPLTSSDPSGDLDALRDRIVSSLAGCDIGTILETDCAPRSNDDGNRAILGDIFHSNPAVVGSPNSPINEAAYQSFAATWRTRDRIIYAGANDGFMHGFLAGEWQTHAGTTPLVPPRHDRGTGAEVMAFMPSEVRKSVWQLPGSQPSGTTRELVTVDGSPSVADAWIYRSVGTGGSLGSEIDPPVSTTKLPDQWRTVLIAGLREGGRSLHALDITDPSSTSYPGYLWEFPCDDCANAANPDTESDEAAWMGLTWSEAVITRVRVAVDGAPAPLGHERWVAIFGAGYDATSDPNSSPSAYDPVATAGRAIYMVDITNGQVLAKKRFAETAESDGSGQYGYPELQYAFAAQPAVFDLDFDGFADVVYMADLGGQIWKWAISAVGDDPIHNTLANDSVGQPNWPFTLFFQADHSDSPDAPTYGTTHFQNFYFPPTGALKHGNLMLAIGAGERVAPEAAGVGEPDSDDANNNHYYVLKDPDPRSKLSTTPATLTEADLVDNADLDAGTYACGEVAAGDGFFLTARDTEKFITNSVIFLGQVTTASFVPRRTPPTRATPPARRTCTASAWNAAKARTPTTRRTAPARRAAT